MFIDVNTSAAQSLLAHFCVVTFALNKMGAEGLSHYQDYYKKLLCMTKFPDILVVWGVRKEKANLKFY